MLKTEKRQGVTLIELLIVALIGGGVFRLHSGRTGRHSVRQI
jgi:prepilin-type N-terminal cleavage/methylation domain-containing protein